MPVSLTGYIDVPTEHIPAVERALVEHIRLTRAEPGCLRFEVTPDQDVAGRFRVSEEFIDQPAFEHHQSRTAASPWASLTKDFKREYTILNSLTNANEKRS